MSFSVPRAELLDLVAKTLAVPDDRRSALLGRFQHLQRLSLIKGINPGRGSAAEYKAHQTVVILIAFKMLDLGLDPARTVPVIQNNQDFVRQAIGLAVTGDDPISPSNLWFDPSVVTRSADNGRGQVHDLADATFNYGGEGTAREMFEHFFVKGSVQGMSFISVSGILWHLVTAIDWDDAEMEGFKPVIKEKSGRFLASLRDWYAASTPGSLV